ncbi:lipid A deacylase LpxR family protein [uncultured Polaribacter sp.]|uniref:lipid A deacylase LpxR family protein n=1 Tax=uncultured Polaribacter sp. TaxID=174711 RepID=UPI002632D269|nr:lipid A deacylase LpxR family protein [uncultured Polaribacter sp.]
MKCIFFTLLLFSTSLIFSQEKFSKEILLTSENDLYVSTSKDRYYTNGFFISYRHLSNKKKESIIKKIYSWEIGHKMYTPFNAVVGSIIEHDRPFAGHLYAGFGISNSYKNNQILKINFQLGVLGENAMAKNLQEFIHEIYGFKKAIGWEYQIENALAINFKLNYYKPLYTSKNNIFDVTNTNYLNIGTVHTNIASGLIARIGFKPLQKNINSVSFNTNLNNKQSDYYNNLESFFYVKPMLQFTCYDATIQGSFLNKNSSVTNEINPFIFNLEMGVKHTINRFILGYSFLYNTNKSKNLRMNNGHSYGQISFNYLLR